MIYISNAVINPTYTHNTRKIRRDVFSINMIVFGCVECVASSQGASFSKLQQWVNTKYGHVSLYIDNLKYG